MKEAKQTELVGYEERTSVIVRSRDEFVTRHPFTNEVYPIARGDWTPEMKKEMEEWMKSHA